MSGRWASIVAIVFAASLGSACSSPSVPHGNPDPGGKRLAGLASVAREALPSGASSTHLALTKSIWGHGGCDGGPPGGTNMEAVQTFRASGDVVADIDASMRRLHWGVVSQLNTTPAGRYSPSAAPGTGLNAPYVREYEPSSNPTKPVAGCSRLPKPTGRPGNSTSRLPQPKYQTTPARTVR
jgi:hypothetical protein